MPESNTVEQVTDYILELLSALDQTLFMPFYNFGFFYDKAISAMYRGNLLGFIMTLAAGGVSMASYLVARRTQKKREAVAFANSYIATTVLLGNTKQAVKHDLVAGLNNALAEAGKSELYAFNLTKDGTRIEINRQSAKKASDSPTLLPGVLGKIQGFFKQPNVKKAMMVVILYMMGYWTLWMIALFIVMVFPALALMPLSLQFVLPGILPAFYLLFSSNNTPTEKDREKEAVRVLAIQILMMRGYEKAFVTKLDEARAQRLEKHLLERKSEKYKPFPIPKIKPVTAFKIRLTETRPKWKFLFKFVSGFMFITFALWPVTDFLGTYGGWVFFAGIGSVIVPFFVGIAVGIIAGVIAYQVAKKKREKNEMLLNKAGITDKVVTALDAQVANINSIKAEIADLRRQLGHRANDPVLNPQVHFPEYDDHTFFTIGHLKTTQKEHLWSMVKKFLQRFRVFLDDMGSAIYITCSTYMVLAFCGAFVMSSSPLLVVFIVTMVIGAIYGVIGAYQKYHKNQQEKHDGALLKRIQMVQQTVEVHQKLLNQQRDYLRESVAIESFSAESSTGKRSAELGMRNGTHAPPQGVAMALR